MMKKLYIILFIFSSSNGLSNEQILDTLKGSHDRFVIQSNQAVLNTKIIFLEKENENLRKSLLKQEQDLKLNISELKEDFKDRLNIYVLFITLILSIIAVAINFFGKLAIKKRVEEIIQNTAENYAELKTNEVLSNKITDEYTSKIISERGETEINRLLFELEKRGQKTIDDIKNKGEKIINSVLAEPPTDKEIEKDKKLSANELFKMAFETDDPIIQTKIYEQVISLEPNNRNALNNIGVALNRQNKFKEAVEYLNKVIELYPTYGLAYANRANSFNHINELEKSLKDAEKAIELNPNLEWAYSIKGNVFTKQKKYEEAEQQLQKAIELNPESPHVYFNRAYFKEETGEYEQSAKDYQKAQDLGFDNKALLYNNLAVLHRRLGKYEKALEYLEKVKNEDPNFPNLYGTMALIYADKSDDNNFYKYLKMALDNGCLAWNYLNDKGFDKYRNTEKLKNIMKPYRDKY